MKISVNGGHTRSAPGASGILDELFCDREIKDNLINVLRQLGHGVNDSTSPDSLDASQDLIYQAQVANSSGCELAVSIHLNAGGGTGTECFYHPTSNAGKEYSAKVSDEISKALGLRNRGAKPGGSLYWLNATDMTAILIEVCFVDSQQDATAYHAIGPANIAKAIAKAIVGAVPEPELPHYLRLTDNRANAAEFGISKEQRGGFVALREMQTGQLLSVANADYTAGKRATLYDPWAQQFKDQQLFKVAEGETEPDPHITSIYIKPKMAQNLCLAVMGAGAGIKPGQGLEWGVAERSKDKRFDLEKVNEVDGSQVYIIVHPDTGLFLSTSLD